MRNVMAGLDWVGAAGKRVLIVDDEPLIRRALADYLEEWGYLPTMAADGAEGLLKARAESFDVLLVDLRMPRVDGLEVIATLKAEQPHLPIVVISGTGVLSDAIEAIRRGAWDYITKPIQDMDEIAVVVRRVVERAELVAERDRYQYELEQLNRSLEAEVGRQTKDLRAQNRRLVALNRISYAISDPLDIDTILNRVLNATVEATEADAGIVRLLNPITRQLVSAAACGLPEAYTSTAGIIPLGEGVVGQVAQTGHICVTDDFADDPWLASLVEAQEGDHSEKGAVFSCLACVPLRAGSESKSIHPIVGTLGVALRNRSTFSKSEVELLASIGNQIGVAVARAQYASDLERTNLQLEQANVDLRRLDMLREQFIQNVAHELRTPLALVCGYMKMLTDEGLEPAEQQHALEVASRHVDVLVDLVESITTLQDVGTHALDVTEIDPAELLGTVVQMCRQKTVSSGVTVRVDVRPDLPALCGDFTRLAQAVSQLLDNACKFSPPGTTVTLAVVDGPDAVGVSVADEGIGIPPEEHERIFERFYQVDGSASRRYGGTGLGLALVKEIVEAHHGQVAVVSAPGEGSTFTIWLPKA
ncbi:MAG: response regulator [Anaerolineae bacterium]|nr:response regulator [Anaerolineae bacterium]